MLKRIFRKLACSKIPTSKNTPNSIKKYNYHVPVGMWENLYLSMGFGVSHISIGSYLASCCLFLLEIRCYWATNNCKNSKKIGQNLS